MSSSAVVHRIRQFNLAGWGLVVVLVLAWQYLIDAKVLTLTYLPAPSTVWSSLVDLAQSGQLADDISHTLVVALIAFALASAIGIAIGVLVAVNRGIWTFSMASVDFLRSLPVIALMPVVLLIWGTSSKSEIIVATYASTWLMLINTIGGVSQIHERLHEVSTTMRLSSSDKMVKIILPAALPSILVGARLAAVSAFVVAIVAEMIISPAGIGWGLVSAQTALDPGVLFAYAIVAGLLGYLVNFVLVTGVNAAFPGMKSLTSGVSR